VTAQARKQVAAADSPFVKCPGCQEFLVRKDIVRKLNVCPKCGHHLRLTADQRILVIADRGSFEEIERGLEAADPLGFEDSVAYPKRIADARARTGKNEAVICGLCTIEGRKAALGVFDFGFLGGSMGSVVGEKLTRLAERALAERAALVIVSASGGARMQEGILSLMQMAKVSAALGRLRDAGLPFVSVLTDPTTGGVAASLAMLGDVNVAEPGALIGFAGPRVIEQTIRQKLPEGFQRSEFLLEHGFLDAVVHRKDMKGFISSAIDLLTS